MKFSPVTSLLIGLVLFLPSPLSTAQQNGDPHPQLEASSPTKRSGAQAAVTQLAQNGTTSPTEPDGSLLTLRAAVSEVHLVFTVTDKHDHYIKDLKQNDFKILDDHKPPQQILSFQSETDLPQQVGLLIDTSQSVHDRFTFEQEAAIAFLKQTLRQKSDQALCRRF